MSLATRLAALWATFDAAIRPRPPTGEFRDAIGNVEPERTPLSDILDRATQAAQHPDEWPALDKAWHEVEARERAHYLDPYRADLAAARTPADLAAIGRRSLLDDDARARARGVNLGGTSRRETRTNPPPPPGYAYIGDGPPVPFGKRAVPPMAHVTTCACQGCRERREADRENARIDASRERQARGRATGRWPI